MLYSDLRYIQCNFIKFKSPMKQTHTFSTFFTIAKNINLQKVTTYTVQRTLL